MSATNLGHVVRPRHCRVSVSADRKELALTFRGDGQAEVTLVLPLLGAAGLQRRLAQTLYLLGVRPATGPNAPAQTAPAQAAPAQTTAASDTATLPVPSAVVAEAAAA